MNSIQKFKFVSSDRRVREDRRFVAGKGQYVADISEAGMLHVAIVHGRHTAAKIIAIDTGRALSMPGVVTIVDGDELAACVEPLMNGLDTPKVLRYPLAVKNVRYNGEWVAAVVARTRAQAEDAVECVDITYEPLPHVIDTAEAYQSSSPPVHAAHGSNILLDRIFNWGDIDGDFAKSDHSLALSVTWGRSSTVPIETFGIVAMWDPWLEVLDIRASIQMPKYADQIARALRLPGNAVRVHYDIDVGGSYGVKRGIKHTVLAGYLAMKLNQPVSLIEDRLENMESGDAQGPDRIFDIEVAFDKDGTMRSMKMRAMDNAGAYAGRAPFQLGKPIGANTGPYRINSVRYHAVSVTSNKAVQEAVRGFGQAPTNYAIETMVDRVAEYLGMDRIEIRRRNFIRHDEFPYLIPSGTRYDSGDYHAVVDKVMQHVDWNTLVAERDRLRAQGFYAGIGISACLEPSGGNSSFEPLLNPANTTTTWMESCRVNVDALGCVTVTIHTTSSGQGHETLAATVIGEILEIDPDAIRIVRTDSLSSLPGNSPVGSRMAVMLGGSCFHAAHKLKTKMIAIAAKNLGCENADIKYSSGVFHAPQSGRQLNWLDLVTIAHRNFHLLPEGFEPGLEATSVYQVPTGTDLPTADGRVQMYPCHSFEFHTVLAVIDPDTGKVDLRRYVIGHDCGTVINPHIVRGMTLGGIAHGIGAALLEEFVYDNQGQMLSQSFMDYLMPSSHEVPQVEIVHHCTPSPYTVMGQKGSGESGYLGAPAAISGAVNDAVRPLGIRFSKLPMRMTAISDAIAEARTNNSV